MPRFQSGVFIFKIPYADSIIKRLPDLSRPFYRNKILELLKIGWAVVLSHVIIFRLIHSFFLQVAQSGDSTLGYLPIGIQLVFAIVLVGGIILLTHIFGPKRDSDEKLQNFESGIEGYGNARRPMAIKYFLVAILFVLFDVEVIFFYPYAVNFRELGWHGFLAIIMFVAFFLFGFIYIIKKGALNWEE